MYKKEAWPVNMYIFVVVALILIKILSVCNKDIEIEMKQ